MSYNPQKDAVVTSKPFGAIGFPIDSRSLFYDEVNFVRRAFLSTEEVLAYFDTPFKREGMFYVFINSTGELQPDGTILGGTRIAYWWKEGTADNQLTVVVEKGDKGDQGIQGVQGDNGWNPKTTIEVVNDRVLRKLIGYFGGEGVEPTLNVGKYEADGEWVSNPEDAQDFVGEVSQAALALKADINSIQQSIRVLSSEFTNSGKDYINASILGIAGTNYNVFDLTGGFNLLENGIDYVPITNGFRLTNPVGITGVYLMGDLSIINFTTKGYLNINLIDDSLITIGFTNSDGVVNNTDPDWRKFLSPVVAGQLYTFSANNFTPNANKNLNCYDVNGNYISGSNVKILTNPFDFIPPMGTSYFIANLKEPAIAVVPTNISLVAVGVETPLVYKMSGKGITAQRIDDNYANNDFVKGNILNNSVTSGGDSPNLINPDNISIGYVGGTGTINNVDTAWRKVRVDLLPSTQYTFSATSFNPTNNKNIVFFTAGGAFISKTEANTNPKTFTTPANTSYIYMNVAYTGDGDVVANVKLYELMINLGGSAIAYTPYLPLIITKIYGYEIPSSSGGGGGGGGSFETILYSELKDRALAGTLTPNYPIVVTGAPGNKTIIVTPKTTTSVSNRIDMPDEKFDFFELDLGNDIIKAYDNIGCVVRNTSGTWGFINDNDHVPKGFSAISSPNTSTLRLTYSKTYTNVISLIVSPDETYAKLGIFVGASAGLSVSDIKFGCNDLSGDIIEVSGVLTVVNNGFQSPLSAVSMNTTTGDITITHSEITNNSPNFLSKNIAHRAVLVSTTPITTVIKIVDNSGNVILSPNGINFSFSRNGVRSLLNSEMGVASTNFWINGIMLTEFKD